MVRANRVHRLLGRIRSGEGGFSMVEAMVAVTILMIAIMMSMQPLMAAMIQITDARTLTVSENLAQAEIEAIRALDYGDVGSPGYSPDGVLPRTRTETVEERDYQVDIVVTYEGSITGLSIIEQGGDGVQGSFDPGVDYKFVQVTVTPADSSSPPVVMETLVAPGNIGAHEGIASIRVTLARYEPFEPSTVPFPSLTITSSPSLPIHSGAHTEQQVFADVPEGDYVVSLDVANGWVIHPDDTAAGQQNVTATPGLLTETNLRVYRPATLVATILDAESGEAVPNARIRLVHNPSGVQTDYAPGEYAITGLMPDAYDISVSAGSYYGWSATSVNIPAGYPNLIHELVVELDPIPPTTTTTSTTTTTTTTTTVPTSSTTTTVPTSSTTTTSTTTTTTTTLPPANTVTIKFVVKDNTGRRVHGATVEVPHPTRGMLTAVTDDRGEAYLDLDEDDRFTATASTEWGHGPDSDDFRARSGTTVDLKLGRPRSYGTYVMRNGDRAQFLVSETGNNWTIIPPNYQGEASFVERSGWFLVAKQCDANGSIEGATWVYVRNNKNLSVWIGGWCPW